ncbi:MAG TPA: hypothetical protein PLD88_05035, partial [Candidatus Berkiella sp.]|nr:hypothetical protein [Candidatus Berkiella sp.]
YRILMHLREKEVELFAEITSDSVLNPIVNIISRHLKDYSSVAELKDKIKFSHSIHNMKHFGESLIDIKHYLTLSELIAKAAVISSLPALEQQSIYSTFKNGELVRLITAENSHLDQEDIKNRFENMAIQLHAELNLKEEEGNKLFKIYHDLTDKYLPEFNRIRHDLIRVLPDFIEAELQRIENSCPDIFVNRVSQSAQSTLVPSYAAFEKLKHSVSTDEDTNKHDKKVKPMAQ